MYEAMWYLMRRVDEAAEKRNDLGQESGLCTKNKKEGARDCMIKERANSSLDQAT